MIMLMIMLACFIDVSCKKDKDKDSNDDNTETNGTGTSGGGAETGVYMGIIGFNHLLHEKSISLLNEETKGNFDLFIDGLYIETGTKLYDAVETGLENLQKTTLPNDLVNAAIVTFTDGIDQSSNPNYTYMEHCNMINDKISNVKIKGANINAYSIGFKGQDITDSVLFKLNLNKMASKPENATIAKNMDDVYTKFSEIADDLYNESQSQILSLSLPVKSKGVEIRITFDNVQDPANSNLYIEGTWSDPSSPSLTNIIYHGLNSSSGITLSGGTAQFNDYYRFSFENLTIGSGMTVPINNMKQYDRVTPSSPWQPNVEFQKEGDIQVTITRKSAVIMLVLDCSSSMKEFSALQNSAKNFVNILCRNTGKSKVITSAAKK